MTRSYDEYLKNDSPTERQRAHTALKERIRSAGRDPAFFDFRLIRAWDTGAQVSILKIQALPK